jgi:hypothetical protein
VARGGVRVAGHEPLAVTASAHGAHLLAAKRAAGHTTGEWCGTAADIPEPIAASPPALTATAGVACVGAYWLPIPTPDPAWFRLDAYQAEDAGPCVVVLTARVETSRPHVAVRRDRIRGRFPLPPAPDAWSPVAARLAREGGFAIFLPETDALDAAADAVIQAHLRGRVRAQTA